MQWQKVIFNTDNFTQGYKKAYAFDIDITLLNYERLPYRKFVLYRAFPTTISNTDFNRLRRMLHIDVVTKTAKVSADRSDNS